MKKIALLLVFFAIGLQAVLAQTREISGTVTSAEDGGTIPGVSVSVKGTTLGTVTDMDGNFRLRIPQDAQTLMFSFVGMLTQEVAISNQSFFRISLVAETIGVDEVVVVGYGTQSVRRMTTSVSSVSENEIQNVPVANVAQALSGKISGVQVSSTSGRPGAPVLMAIRGRSSIAAGNDPLIVIDGVPIANTQDLYNTTMGQGFSPLANINPDDIASIDVLKDAAAAAIYGSRGSNGVILITTKKGKPNEQSSITFSTYYGVQSIIKERELLGASDYRQMYNDALVNSGGQPFFTAAQISNPEHDVNWIDQIKKDNPIHCCPVNRNICNFSFLTVS